MEQKTSIPRKSFSHPCHLSLKVPLSRGGSRSFFRRGYTRLLLYFNTNKPHSFFFLQDTSCIRKPQVISGGGHTPCTLPLDLPLPCMLQVNIKFRLRFFIYELKLGDKGNWEFKPEFNFDLQQNMANKASMNLLQIHWLSVFFHRICNVFLTRF